MCKALLCSLESLLESAAEAEWPQRHATCTSSMQLWTEEQQTRNSLCAPHLPWKAGELLQSEARACTSWQRLSRVANGLRHTWLVADQVYRLSVYSYRSFQDEHLGCNSFEEESFSTMLRHTVRGTFPPVWEVWVAICASANGYLESLSSEGLAGENHAANDVGAGGKRGTENRLPGAA